MNRLVTATTSSRVATPGALWCVEGGRLACRDRPEAAPATYAGAVQARMARASLEWTSRTTLGSLRYRVVAKIRRGSLLGKAVRVKIRRNRSSGCR